jgi:hypothetical protein
MEIMLIINAFLIEKIEYGECGRVSGVPEHEPAHLLEGEEQS